MGSETNRAARVYIVTAKHVIEQIRLTGATETYIMGNLRDPNQIAFSTPIPVDEWHLSEEAGVDVALVEYGISSHGYHFVFLSDSIVDRFSIEENDIRHGENAFIVGLFNYHFGETKYMPIVRIGNLAAFDDEPISTSSYGKIRAYLIESRSTGGLSGSPVFLNLGSTRVIRGETVNTKDGEPKILLLGLIHGHFEMKFPQDLKINDPIVYEQLNAGIAIVTPASYIRDEIENYERTAKFISGKHIF